MAGYASSTDGTDGKFDASGLSRSIVSFLMPNELLLIFLLRRDESLWVAVGEQPGTYVWQRQMPHRLPVGVPILLPILLAHALSVRGTQPSAVRRSVAPSPGATNRSFWRSYGWRYGNRLRSS